MNAPHRSLIFLVPLAMALGCSQPKGYTPKAVPPVEEVTLASATPQNLFGLQPNREWIYEVETVTVQSGRRNTERGEVKLIVTGVRDVAEGKRYTIEVRRDMTTVDRQNWLVTAKGIYQTTGTTKDVVLQPMQPIVQFPLEVGKRFIWRGQGPTPIGTVGRNDAETVCLGPQIADTGVGRQGSIAFEQRATFRAGNVQGLQVAYTWYKPDLGIVRNKQTVGFANGTQVITTLRLKELPK
jgi:hypothetical protein